LIKHIVLLKLLVQAAGRSREENLHLIRKSLEALPESIPEIAYLEVGLNISHSERAMDLVLITAFETLEDLEVYIQHPDHQEAARFIRSVTSDRRVVDFEV
jgi:hypothetical protein